MRTSQRFSNNTIAYLDSYGEILGEMIQKMTAVLPTDSISGTFIMQMVPHHQAAIAMSRNLLQYTTCIALQEIAQSIIREQTKGIRQMEDALLGCQKSCNSDRELQGYFHNYQQITERMFTKMKQAQPANNINVSFIREMIPHHRGAVAMSRNTLAYPICRELTPILTSIITTQEQGIRQMEQLLRHLEPRGC